MPTLDLSPAELRYIQRTLMSLNVDTTPPKVNTYFDIQHKVSEALHTPLVPLASEPVSPNDSGDLMRRSVTIIVKENDKEFTVESAILNAWPGRESKPLNEMIVETSAEALSRLAELRRQESNEEIDRLGALEIDRLDEQREPGFRVTP